MLVLVPNKLKNWQQQRDLIKLQQQIDVYKTLLDASINLEKAIEPKGACHLIKTWCKSYNALLNSLIANENQLVASDVLPSNILGKYLINQPLLISSHIIANLLVLKQTKDAKVFADLFQEIFINKKLKKTYKKHPKMMYDIIKKALGMQKDLCHSAWHIANDLGLQQDPQLISTYLFNLHAKNNITIKDLKIYLNSNTDASVLILLGKIWPQQDLSIAKNYFAKQTSISSKLALARLLYREKKYNLALKEYQEINSFIENESEFWLEIAILYNELGRYNDSLFWLNKYQAIREQ